MRAARRFFRHARDHGLRYALDRGFDYLAWRRRRAAGTAPAAARKLSFCCFGTIDSCMLRCRMCRKWQEDLRIKEHDACGLDDWKAAADSLRDAWPGPLQINFGGGEPLSNPWLLDLVAYCKKKGFLTNIASNGWLIDREMAGRIAGSGLDSIILSLDSLDAPVHDALRGVPGVHGKVMDAIGFLENEKSSLYKGICCVLYGPNLGQAPRLAQWVDSREEIDSIYFMAAMQPNNTPVRPEWYRDPEFSGLWPDDPEKACAVIDELERLRENGSKIINRKAQLDAFKRYYRDPGRFVKRSRCDMDTALNISSCGDIFHCYEFPPLGNIRKDTISSALASPAAERTRREIARCAKNCHSMLNCFFTEEPR